MSQWTIGITVEDADVNLKIDGRALRVRRVSAQETVGLFDPDEELYGVDAYALEDSLAEEATYYAVRQDALEAAWHRLSDGVLGALRDLQKPSRQA